MTSSWVAENPVIFPAGDRYYGNALAATNTGSNTAVSKHVVDKLQRGTA
jgi:hypothetical protein